MVADELKTQLDTVLEIIKEEFEPVAEIIGFLKKEIRSISNNFENIQTAVWIVKQVKQEFKLAVEMLQDKIARLEDKSHQCNNGSDPVGFMQAHLSQWIPSLKNRSVEIETKPP